MTRFLALSTTALLFSGAAIAGNWEGDSYEGSYQENYESSYQENYEGSYQDNYESSYQENYERSYQDSSGYDEGSHGGDWN